MTVPNTRFLVRMFSAINVFVYRLTGGVIGGRLSGCPVLLLTTLGRRTGRKRTTPVLYLTDGYTWVVVASNGGSSQHPGWWLSLRESPDAEIQIGGAKLKVRARAAVPEEKRRLWPLLVKMYPPYDAYQRRTSREIPVVILDQTSFSPA